MKEEGTKCRRNINHLNRIQGQIETLKKYIEEDKHCAEIAQLTTSIAKSFDSLRATTLENFVINEFSPSDKKLPKSKIDTLKRIINLYKK